jgi:hypothetical protein
MRGQIHRGREARAYGADEQEAAPSLALVSEPPGQWSSDQPHCGRKRHDGADFRRGKPALLEKVGQEGRYDAERGIERRVENYEAYQR